MKTVSRLKQLLADKYGKGLQIKKMISADFVNSTERSGDFMIENGDLLVPLRSQGNYFGMAIVPAIKDLSSEDTDSITQLLKMVLTPLLYNEYLSTREDNLLNNQKERNVFQLKASALANKPRMLSPVISMCTKNTMLFMKAAHELHDLSRNWSLVEYHAIQASVQSSKNLLELDSTTILVREFENLSDQERAMIQEVKLCSSNNNLPLIILGSEKKINEETLELDKTPLNTLTLRQVLELYCIDPWSPVLS